MESDPSENEVKRVESLVQRLIVSRSRRESYEIERKMRKLVKVEKSLKEVGIPVPGDLQKSLKELKSRGEEIKKGLPEVPKKVVKEK